MEIPKIEKILAKMGDKDAIERIKMIRLENKRQKEEELRKNKIISRLNPEESQLREKILIITLYRWGDRVVDQYNDPKNCPPELKKAIINGINSMKEITKTRLNQIKKLLTPREYNWFLPVYDEFKRTKKFTVSDPSVRD